MKMPKNKELLIFCAGFMFGMISFYICYSPILSGSFLSDVIWKINLLPLHLIFSIIERFFLEQYDAWPSFFVKFLVSIINGALFGVFLGVVYEIYKLVKKFYKLAKKSIQDSSTVPMG